MLFVIDLVTGYVYRFFCSRERDNIKIVEAAGSEAFPCTGAMIRL